MQEEEGSTVQADALKNPSSPSKFLTTWRRRVLLGGRLAAVGRSDLTPLAGESLNGSSAALLSQICLSSGSALEDFGLTGAEKKAQTLVFHELIG